MSLLFSYMVMMIFWALALVFTIASLVLEEFCRRTNKTEIFKDLTLGITIGCIISTIILTLIDYVKH